MFVWKLNDDTEMRLLEPRHAKQLFELIDANREHLRKWLPWADRTNSVEDSMQAIKEALKRFLDTGGFDAGLWYKGQLAGVIGLWRGGHQNPFAEIGYWIGEEFLGKGLATVSCKALTDYVFQELDVQRLELVTACENSPSCKLAERLGFTFEGKKRGAAFLPAGRADLAVYSMLLEEWEAQR